MVGSNHPATIDDERMTTESKQQNSGLQEECTGGAPTDLLPTAPLTVALEPEGATVAKSGGASCLSPLRPQWVEAAEAFAEMSKKTIAKKAVSLLTEGVSPAQLLDHHPDVGAIEEADLTKQQYYGALNYHCIEVLKGMTRKREQPIVLRDINEQLWREWTSSGLLTQTEAECYVKSLLGVPARQRKETEKTGAESDQPVPAVAVRDEVPLPSLSATNSLGGSLARTPEVNQGPLQNRVNGLNGSLARMPEGYQGPLQVRVKSSLERMPGLTDHQDSLQPMIQSLADWAQVIEDRVEFVKEELGERAYGRLNDVAMSYLARRKHRLQGGMGIPRELDWAIRSR